MDKRPKFLLIEVSQPYAKPNAAVIAADKMNVVYRGVDNPMTISIPGIPDNKVTGSAAGLSKGCQKRKIYYASR